MVPFTTTSEKRKKASTSCPIISAVCQQANVEYVLKHNPELSPQKVELAPNCVELLPDFQDIDRAQVQK